MGIDDIWGYAIYICRVQKKIIRGKIKLCNFIILGMFSKSLENHQVRDTSIGGEAICSQKTQNIGEYWGGVRKLISWYNPRKQNVVDLAFEFRV